MYIKKHDKNSYLIYTLVEETSDDIYQKLITLFKEGDLLTTLNYIQNGFKHPETEPTFYHFKIIVAKSTWSNLILKRQIKRHVEICKKLNYPYREPICDKNTTIFVKKYYSDYLKLCNIQPYRDTYNKTYKQLSILHTLKYAHGNIRPTNIIFKDDTINLVNFECTVSKQKRETHCKKIDLKFASLSLINQHNIKYPRRNFEFALLDDYEALILTFVYILCGENDLIFLKNIEIDRYLSVEDATKYIEDNSLPDTFHPYIIDKYKEFRNLLADLYCVRYKLKKEFNGELLTTSKTAEES